LNGRRDLPLAPSPRAGFEMNVLRMLAFRPDAAGVQAHPQTTPATAATTTRNASAADVARAALAKDPPPLTRPAAQAPAAPSAESPTLPPVPETIAGPSAGAAKAAVDTSSDAGGATVSIDAERWLELVANSGLRGPTRELAAHSSFVAYDAGVLRLALPAADEHLKGPALVKLLADALAPQLGVAPQIRFEAGAASGETLHVRNERQRDARQASAEEAFMSDPDVQRLIQRGARVVHDSIRPVDD